MADDFESIDLDQLDEVTGGRYAKLSGTEIKPELIQAISQLAEAVKTITSSKAATEQQKFTQLFQFMQKMMEEKKGGGK